MNSLIKDNVISDQIRQKGNEAFGKGDYFDALTMYNEALRYAESESKQLGLCFSNRSAAFLKVKQYNACMENIELARRNQCPQDILSKLSVREDQCKKLLEKRPRIEKTWNSFFKLSYPPNPKLPFLVNCLELKTHERGVFLIAKRNLNAGDIIAITEPFVSFPVDTSSYRCNYCLIDNFMNFIPCPGCTKVMFCTENCMQKAQNEFHQFECNIDDNPDIDLFQTNVLRMIVKCTSLFGGKQKELEKFIASNMKKLLTPFDFDLSSQSSLSEKNIMLTQLCDNQQYGKLFRFDIEFLKIRPFLLRHPKLLDIVTLRMFNLVGNYVMGDAKRFKSIGGKALSTTHQDQDLFKINYYGDTIDICFNLIRYSCVPNTVLHPYNGKIVWVVQYPIKANDWLTIAFNNHVFFEKSLQERLDAEKHNCHEIVAKCKCPACVGKWKRVDSLIAFPIYTMRYSSEEAIQKFGEYSNDINRLSKQLAENDELIWFTINYFRWNLMSIGKPSFWDNIPLTEISDPIEEMMNFAIKRNERYAQK